MSESNVVIPLRRERPGVVARRTKASLAIGVPVVWIWNRDRDVRAAMRALGDWRAPYGGTWRLGNGQSAAYFSRTARNGPALTYWVREDA